MKKILFILHFPPPVHGSSMVGQAIRDSKLINSSFDCRYINLLVSRTIQETGKPGALKMLRFVGIWFKLLVELINKRPDICYLALSTTGASFYKDVMLVALLRVFSVKRVYHLHNKGVRQKQTNQINKFFYGFVFKNANIIILSNQLYKDVETFVPASLIYACPNGIVDTTTDFKAYLLPKEKPVKVLFLSNLMEAKGVFVLLEACSILQQKGMDFECFFVGAEGDLNASQFAEVVRQKQLSSRVNYLGKKFGKDKHEVFASADIFIHPTLNDCFPLVLLEAMQYSLPVISTFEGGIPDIVEEGITGFLVPPKNALALAERLEELIINATLRRQMGKAGRTKYEKEFTLEIFEHRMTEILPKIIEQL